MQHDTTDLLMMAVARNPDDDLPRLVLADHLDETGQVEWAAFIRTHTFIVRGELDRKSREKNLIDVFRRAVPKVFKIERFLSATVPLASPQRHTFEFKLKDFDRGFPAVVHCTEQEWLDHGPNLVKLCPITRVVVTNRMPHWNGRAYCWFNQDRNFPSPAVPDAAMIASILFDRVYLPKHASYKISGRSVGYKTVQDSKHALSEACLSYARELAFPPA